MFVIYVKAIIYLLLYNLHSCTFDGRLRSSVDPHLRYNEHDLNILASLAVPEIPVKISKNIKFEPTTTCVLMMYFCFLKKQLSRLPDQGDNSLCVPSMAPPSITLSKLVKTFNSFSGFVKCIRKFDNIRKLFLS